MTLIIIITVSTMISDTKHLRPYLTYSFPNSFYMLLSSVLIFQDYEIHYS